LRAAQPASAHIAPRARAAAQRLQPACVQRASVVLLLRFSAQPCRELNIPRPKAMHALARISVTAVKLYHF
jgi:hypothetical protein